MNSLNYPVNTVGAWIDPNIPILRSDSLVKDCFKYLRHNASLSHVFVESAEDGRFAGAITILELIASRHGAELREVPMVRIQPVSNRASLASTRFHSAWDDFIALPVVGRRGNVLGGLTRSGLRRGMHEHHVKLEHQKSSVACELINALLASSAGIARLITRPERSSEPVSKQEVFDERQDR
jgi:predicted transcriptional regulator